MTTQLTPQEAALTAQHVYQARSARPQELKDTFSAIGLRDFALSGEALDGISGPQPMKIMTGFSYIAKGTASRSGEAIVAIRGTDTLADAWTDLNAGFVRGPTGAWVHSGFMDTFNSIGPVIGDWFRRNDVSHVHCVGHSLGGALATLTADMLSETGRRVSLYTYGSPRVGTYAFADKLAYKLTDRIFRVHNRADIVPMVPPWQYLHAPIAGPKYRLGWSGGSIAIGAHFMTNYIAGIKQADWRALAAQAEPGDLEAEAKALLGSASTVDKILMYSVGGYEVIGKCLMWLLSKTATLMGAEALAAMTVIDHLAYLVYRANDLIVDASEMIATLLIWIMKFLGRTAVAVKDASLALIRWTLSLFFGVVQSMAVRAARFVLSVPHIP